ncbi:MAG: hypothetical protein MJ089_09090, partial [Ruminococcus sp.]|nr:hypothetical protein [Ruminococcus sp.]
MKKVISAVFAVAIILISAIPAFAAENDEAVGVTEYYPSPTASTAVDPSNPSYPSYPYDPSNPSYPSYPYDPSNPS